MPNFHYLIPTVEKNGFEGERSLILLIGSFRGKRGFGGGKRLILFTDLGGEFGDDQIESIILAMKQADVHFNVM